KASLSGCTFSVKQMSSYFIPKARWVSDLKFRLVLTTKYCHKVLADTMPIGLEVIFKDLLVSSSARLLLTSLIVRLQVGGILASHAFHPTLTEAV
ncbi:hypothetical protein WME70_18210, partial [Microcoleus anatoxicus PTRS1]